MKAIILAAGLGTRLRPITLNTPKALIIVNKKPLIERQIEYLKEKGIDDIVIVLGYLKEKFFYLQEKYGVKIVINPKYNSYNNIYSMYLVREYLSDCYVIEGDVYLNNNFIDENLNRSTYFSGFKKEFENEWILQFDEDNKIIDINPNNGSGYIMSGISYWNKEDGIFIRSCLEKLIKDKHIKNLYWDNVVKDNLNSLNIYIKKIKSNDWIEIDSVEDLQKCTDC